MTNSTNTYNLTFALVETKWKVPAKAVVYRPMLHAQMKLRSMDIHRYSLFTRKSRQCLNTSNCYRHPTAHLPIRTNQSYRLLTVEVIYARVNISLLLSLPVYHYSLHIYTNLRRNNTLKYLDSVRKFPLCRKKTLAEGNRNLLVQKSKV